MEDPGSIKTVWKRNKDAWNRIKAPRSLKRRKGYTRICANGRERIIAATLTDHSNTTRREAHNDAVSTHKRLSEHYKELLEDGKELNLPSSG